MSEKVDVLAEDYRSIPAVQILCDHLTRAADGVHGRAMEVTRHDDKRAVVDVSVK